MTNHFLYYDSGRSRRPLPGYYKLVHHPGFFGDIREPGHRFWTWRYVSPQSVPRPMKPWMPGDPIPAPWKPKPKRTPKVNPGVKSMDGVPEEGKRDVRSCEAGQQDKGNTYKTPLPEYFTKDSTKKAKNVRYTGYFKVLKYYPGNGGCDNYIWKYVSKEEHYATRKVRSLDEPIPSHWKLADTIPMPWIQDDPLPLPWKPLEPKREVWGPNDPIPMPWKTDTQQIPTLIPNVNLEARAANKTSNRNLEAEADDDCIIIDEEFPSQQSHDGRKRFVQENTRGPWQPSRDAMKRSAQETTRGPSQSSRDGLKRSAQESTRGPWQASRVAMTRSAQETARGPWQSSRDAMTRSAQNTSRGPWQPSRDAMNRSVPETARGPLQPSRDAMKRSAPETARGPWQPSRDAMKRSAQGTTRGPSQPSLHAMKRSAQATFRGPWQPACDTINKTNRTPYGYSQDAAANTTPYGNSQAAAANTIQYGNLQAAAANTTSYGISQATTANTTPILYLQAAAANTTTYGVSQAATANTTPTGNLQAAAENTTPVENLVGQATENICLFILIENTNASLNTPNPAQLTPDRNISQISQNPIWPSHDEMLSSVQESSQNTLQQPSRDGRKRSAPETSSNPSQPSHAFKKGKT